MWTRYFTYTVIWIVLSLNITVYNQEESIIVGYSIRMPSKILNKEVKLSIHIPNDYDESEEKYPVLYTFQTHFEQVAGAVKNLYDYGLIPKTIVVLIDNYEFGYLTPTKVESNPNSGKADLFLQFFNEELFAFIDSTYRTHPYRTIFSNSWGAMFATYAVLAKPKIFNSAIASIPWIPFDRENKYMISEAGKFLNNNVYQNYLYMTMDNESEILPDLETFLKILKTTPKAGLEWEYHYWPEEDHTSTPYRSIYSGLRSLYNEWNHIPLEIAAKGLGAIKKHEFNLNKKFGYKIGISPNALRLAGQEQQNNDNFDEAISIYKYAIDKQPTRPFGYVTLGRVYEKIGKLALAKEAFQKAYELAETTSHPQIKWVKTFLDKINEKINKIE